MRSAPRIAALVWIALAAACAEPKPIFGSGGDPSDSWPGATQCTQGVRPNVCSQEQRPVCGRSQTGSRRTYPNGCQACLDTAVVDHRPGACPR